MVQGSDNAQALWIGESVGLVAKIVDHVFRVHDFNAGGWGCFVEDMPTGKHDQWSDRDRLAGFPLKIAGEPLRVAVCLEHCARICSGGKMKSIFMDVNLVGGVARTATAAVAGCCLNYEHTLWADGDMVDVPVVAGGEVVEGAVTGVGDLNESLADDLFPAETKAAIPGQGNEPRDSEKEEKRGGGSKQNNAGVQNGRPSGGAVAPGGGFEVGGQHRRNAGNCRKEPIFEQ